MKIQLLASILGLVLVGQAFEVQAVAGEKFKTVSCGDVITESITLGNDLNCPDTTGYALKIIGDHIKVDGERHVIYAPRAVAGVYVQGTGVTLSSIRVQGVSGGSGVFAYDSPGLTLNQNSFSNNGTGIYLYAEKTVMKDVRVSRNTASKNTLFGIRTGQDGSGSIVDPYISGNDFSESGSYAMFIDASHDVLGLCERNNLTRSTNGIYLKGGVFLIHNLSLSREEIQKTAIFVDSAKSLTATNLDLSSVLPVDSNQERFGLNLYRVGSFAIRNLVSNHTDVGLKLDTDSGVSSHGSIRSCVFWNNAFAGIMIRSYDGTPYGVLDFAHNRFLENSPASKIFTTAGTVWTAP